MHSSKTWIEISKKNLLHNFREFRKITGKRTKIACVVKANAYGHGLEQIVSILKDKTDWFAVDDVDEALQIRRMGINKPILILGYVLPARLKETIENDISLTIYDKKILQKIVSLKLKTPARIHLKAETGLHRQGVEKNELLSMANFIIKNSSHLLLEGLSTHFADIEDTLDPSFANEQLNRFNEVRKAINKLGIRPMVHCAASAAAFLYPKTHFNMIRAGIGLYGLWPSKETRIALKLKKKNIKLKPVLSWKSTIAQVKTIKTGESVGYGRTWFAPRKSKIAIVPVGYYDGYDRKLSSNSRVVVKGKYAHVVGRIAMNMVMVDVTEAKEVKARDKVVLIGKSGENEITTDELADKIGTINYEVVSRISLSVRRIIV